MFGPIAAYNWDTTGGEALTSTLDVPQQCAYISARFMKIRESFGVPL